MFVLAEVIVRGNESVGKITVPPAGNAYFGAGFGVVFNDDFGAVKRAGAHQPAGSRAEDSGVKNSVL